MLNKPAIRRKRSELASRDTLWLTVLTHFSVSTDVNEPDFKHVVKSPKGARTKISRPPQGPSLSLLVPFYLPSPRPRSSSVCDLRRCIMAGQLGGFGSRSSPQRTRQWRNVRLFFLFPCISLPCSLVPLFSVLIARTTHQDRKSVSIHSELGKRSERTNGRFG